MINRKLLLCGLIAISASAAAQDVTFKPFAANFKTAEFQLPLLIQAADAAVPATPKNIKLIDRQTAVRMTWDAVPQEGVAGGAIDPQQVIYTIYDLKSDGSGETQAVGRAEVKGQTQYDIEMNTDDGEPSLLQYGLSARQDGKDSQIGLSEPLAIGKPYQLPLSESFRNGDVETFWWADCDNVDDYGLLTDASLKSADGDNGCFGFLGETVGQECTLVSHKISLAGAENPTVSFSQFIPASGQVPITLEVVRPDGSVESVEVKTVGTETAGSWAAKYASLKDFAQDRYVVLRFRFKAETIKQLTAIDAIRVSDEKQNNLAVSLIAPKKLVKGQKGKATVTVENTTANNSKQFVLRCYAGGKQVYLTTGRTSLLKGYKKMSYSFDVATSSINPDLETLPLKAELTVTDDDAKDNTAEATVQLETTWRNGVENLSVQTSGKTTQLTWGEPKKNQQTVTDGFEDYEPWSTAFGEWTLVDVDKATSGGVFEKSDYPHYGEPFAFIVMNPSDIGETLQAHSGSQFAGSPYPYYDAANDAYYPDADDWLISPELSGNRQTITFWAMNLRTQDYNGNWQDNDETFYFLGSKTDTEIKSFTDYYSHGISHKFDVYGGEWTEYSVTVDEGTRYFGIHHTTPATEGLMLMFDDFTFEKGGTPVGYNVYRDGEKQGVSQTTSMTISGNADGEHTYAVTAVYADGSESAPVFVSATTGIRSVAMASSQENTVLYTLDGKSVGKMRQGMKPGVYVAGNKKIVIK